ncbi:MAG: hypothetical protein IPI54_03435 [Chitinophagaceae bacterium]|nr:hypothetical protein [Chitinophagaceae bacterium]
MAINKNHEFEELDGVKCGIVEKNVSPERVAFLKKLLDYNKFTVVVVPSPPPKVAAVPVVKVAEGEEAPPPSPAPPPAPATFTVGVTDYTFNTINAIYGRLLKTPDGHIVTMAFWQQKENVSHDEIPYYEDVN